MKITHVPLAIKRYIDDELYINYGVATPSGDIVCSKLAFPENDNLAKRIPEYVEMISSKKFVVTNFGVSAVSSEPRIGVGYPHLDREGNVQSGLFLSIRLTYVNDYIDGFDLPKNSEFLVTDDLGSIVIVYPSDNALLGKMKFPAVTFSLVLSQKSGVLKFKGEDGIERIYAYAPFYLNEKKDLISFMLFGIPTEKYFFEVSNSQLRTQIALLVLSLIGELTIFSLIMKSKRK
ncbi:hypothetical protein HYV12_02090 [Candidatus Dojkabacteria bacterium]|nr:hypothetical protein [Candidatus Dojkabacteria bacterium]